MRHCGVDVHLKTSDLCLLSSAGKVLGRERFASTQAGFRKQFEGVARMRVVMESGGSTPWIYRLLCALGRSGRCPGEVPAAFPGELGKSANQ